MVDIHTHVLPSVDDGAEDIQDALQMIGVAAASGTTDIVFTPHYLTPDMRSLGFSKSELLDKFESFKKKALERFPEIGMYLGAETFAVTNISELIETNKIITLNNSKYVLLEFPFDDNQQRALDITKQLISGGYYVVIAHPERYQFVQQNPRSIVPFLKEGALLQLNAMSILGGAGFAAQDVALSFLENDLVAVVASDGHSVMHRPPDLSEAYSFICSEFSFEYAEALFYNNPSAIIKGTKI